MQNASSTDHGVWLRRGRGQQGSGAGLLREVAALAPFRGPHSNTWTVQAGSSAAAETRPAPHPQARPRPPPLQLSRVRVEGAARIPSLEAHLPGPGDKVLAQPPPPHTTQTPTSHCSMLASWRMGTNHHRVIHDTGSLPHASAGLRGVRWVHGAAFFLGGRVLPGGLGERLLLAFASLKGGCIPWLTASR